MKENDNQKSEERKKVAIVVIHGMGNQYPMDTITGFTKNVFGEITFSAPERVSGSTDLRKLITFDDTYQYDNYEYYWAHLAKEPPLYHTLRWIVQLAWKKSPSARLKKYIPLIRLITLIVPLAILGVAFGYSLLFYCFIPTSPPLVRFLIYLIPFALYFLVFLGLKFISQRFGDVLRYTVPHPDNLSYRQNITKNAVDFLTTLHQKFEYDKIIIVGHSLGSVVAYEMLIHTFANLNKSFIHKNGLTEDQKKVIDGITNHTNKLKKMQEFGWNWKVTDFITCGSPLCHADMILTKDKDAFNNKVEYGEYPQSPPKRLKENHFYQPTSKDYYLPTHDTLFNYVTWNNIYFENDTFGGCLTGNFGAGITNYKLYPNIYKFIIASHSEYWNASEEPESVQIFKNIIIP